MTTNVVTVPAHIMARQQARINTGAKSAIMSAVVGEGFSIPKVSIRAGRYRLVEDGVETPVGVTLDVVVVGANPHISKVFYAKAFSGDLDVRPDCFSNDGIKPEASVENPVSTNCAGCPNNVLGSKVNPSGAKSKLCGDQRHLAVVAAADPTKPYALTVSVASMKNLREYFKDLQNYGLTPEEVITTLGFDETASYPKITFAQKGYVPEKAMARIDSIITSDEVKEVVRLIPMTPKRPTGLAIAQASAPAAVDDAYEEEAAAAPVAAPAVQAKAKPAPKAAAPQPVAEPVAEKGGIAELDAALDSLFGDD